MKISRMVPANTECFECHKPVTQRDITCTMVMVTAPLGTLRFPAYFHFTCVVKILQSHAVEIMNRDKWADKRAAEKQNADLLADTLGYSRVIREDSEETK